MTLVSKNPSNMAYIISMTGAGNPDVRPWGRKVGKDGYLPMDGWINGWEYVHMCTRG